MDALTGSSQFEKKMKGPISILMGRQSKKCLKFVGLRAIDHMPNLKGSTF